MTNSFPERKHWLDALRAMAILFVVMGHQAHWWGNFFTFTTPIKIPLFFAISGYLFNPRGGDSKSFFLNLFRKLVFPYFCLVTIPAVFYSMYHGISVLLNSWYSILSGDTYWFKTCIIVAEVIHFVIRKYCHKIWQISLVCLLCAFIGFILSKYGLGNFGTINTALICQAYLLLGLLIKKNECFLDRIRLPYTIVAILAYIALCYSARFFFDETGFDCHHNRYYNVPYCWLLIALGCTSCFLLAKQIWRFPRWLVFVGQNTLVLYLWAGHAMLLFVALSKLGIFLPERSILVAFLQTVYECVACMCAAYIINRYIPVILGKKNK